MTKAKSILYISFWLCVREILLITTTTTRNIEAGVNNNLESKYLLERGGKIITIDTSSKKISGRFSKTRIFYNTNTINI